jgi:stage III sporulation protein AB
MGVNIILRICGAVLIVRTTYGIGKLYGDYFNTRLKELYELMAAVRVIKGELGYAIAELPEVFAHAADRAEGNVAIWLLGLSEKMDENIMRGFDDIWQEQMVAFEFLTHLSGRQMDMVGELGQIFGYLDVETQIEGMEVWEKNIRYEYENERSRADSIRKLSGSIGFLGGLVVVIMLL